MKLAKILARVSGIMANGIMANGIIQIKRGGLVALLVVLLGVVWVDADAQTPEEANRAFENGEYDRAAELFRAAIAENPEDARLYFNLGNALSKAGKPEEAEEAYRQFQTRTDLAEDQAMADYNLGTAMSELGELEDGLAHLRNALRRNPNDEDAKMNYEMALRQLQEQQEQEQQQQQQDQNQSDQDQDQDQKDQQQDQQDQQQQNQQQNQQQQNQQDQQDQQQQDQQQQDQQQQDQDSSTAPPQQEGSSAGAKPEQISKEEAENLLKALEQLEKSILKNRKKASEEPVTNEKDW